MGDPYFDRTTLAVGIIGVIGVLGAHIAVNDAPFSGASRGFLGSILLFLVLVMLWLARRGAR